MGKQLPVDPDSPVAPYKGYRLSSKTSNDFVIVFIYLLHQKHQLLRSILSNDITFRVVVIKICVIVKLTCRPRTSSYSTCSGASRNTCRPDILPLRTTIVFRIGKSFANIMKKGKIV